MTLSQYYQKRDNWVPKHETIVDSFTPIHNRKTYEPKRSS